MVRSKKANKSIKPRVFQPFYFNELWCNPSMSPMNVRNRFPFCVFIFGFFAIVKKIPKLNTHEEKSFAKFKHGNLGPIKKMQITNRKKKRKKERLAFYIATAYKMYVLTIHKLF